MVTTIQTNSGQILVDKTHVTLQSASDHPQARAPPSNLIPLSLEQTDFVNFSVGCPVFYNIRSRGDQGQFRSMCDVTEGTVQSASLDTVSRKFWYDIKRRKQLIMPSSESEKEHIDTVIEDDILYACKCPILLDDTIEGEIVHFKPVEQRDSESETFHYTVLYFTGDDRLRIEDGVSAGINGRIKYRRMKNGQQSIPQDTAFENRANKDKGSSPLDLVNLPINDDHSQNEVSEISESSDVGTMAPVDVMGNREAEVYEIAARTEQQPIGTDKTSNNTVDESENTKKKNHDSALLDFCETSKHDRKTVGTMPTACHKGFKINKKSTVARPKTIHSTMKINTPFNSTLERAKVLNPSSTSNDSSKSSSELGSFLPPKSSEPLPSSIHMTNQCDGEKSNATVMASTTNESKVTRTTQSVESPLELDLDTVEEEEEEEVIYISSSESLLLADQKSQSETEMNRLERKPRKESTPVNVSTGSNDQHAEPAQRKNTQIIQSIPRKQTSGGRSNILSSLSNMTDVALTKSHDLLREPLIHPRSIEHQMLKNPPAPRKRELVNNSSSPSKVPKCDKYTPLTLILTIPHWVNPKQLCNHFLERGGYRTRKIRSSSGCNLHVRERGLPMIITLKSFEETNLIAAKEMVEQCIHECMNDRLSEGRLSFELSSTLRGTFETIRSQSGAVTKRINDTSHGWIQLIEFPSVRKDGIRKDGNRVLLDPNIMHMIQKETNCSARLFIDQSVNSHPMCSEPYVLISGRHLEDIDKAASIMTDSRHYLREN